MSFNPSFSLGKIQITLHGLLRDALSVGLGILLMLLLTSDNLWMVLLGISITLGTGYIAVTELMKLRWAIRYQFLQKNRLPSTKKEKLSKEKEDKVKSLMLFGLKADYPLSSSESSQHSCFLPCNYSQTEQKTALADINNWQQSPSLEDKVMTGENFDLKSLERLKVGVYKVKKPKQKVNRFNK
jgi:hypothetical protein